MKHLNLTILALLLSIASFAQVAAITGPGAVCIGSTITLADATTGGTWTCSTGFATVSGGMVTGISAGVAIITYTVGAYDTTYPVTVNALPAPITGPSAACPGTTITEAASPAGGAWSISPTVVATIGSGSGVLTGVAAGVATLTYTIGTGCAATKTITVSPAPPAISGTPSVCAGGTTSLTDVAFGGTWSSSNPAIASVGSTGDVSGTAAGSTTISYTLGTGCASIITVTVTTAPPVHNITGGGNYCAGGTGVMIGLDGSDAGVTYQLYNGGAAMGSPVAGTGAALSFGYQTATGTYTVVATGTSCTTTMSGSAVVSVGLLPTAFPVTGGGSYCAGGTGVAVGLASSATGIAYQLYNGTSTIGTPLMGTGSAISFGLQTVAGIYTIIASNTITGCVNIMTGSATVSIDALPTAYTLSGGGSYCVGGSGATITLSGSDLGVSYQLYSGGVPVGSPVLGTGGTISFGPVTIAGSYTISATGGSGCVSSMSGTSIITVNPLPTIYTVTGGGSYCAGGAGVHIILSSSDPGVNYDLFLGGTLISTVPGTGAPIDFGMMTAAGTYTVAAINAVTGCTDSMSGSPVITITPTTTPSVTITTAPGDTVCSGTTVTFTAVPAGGGPTPTYSWIVDGITVGLGSTYSYMPASGDIVGIAMTSSATCATPATATSSMTMTVLPVTTPTIAITALPGLTVCTGTTVSYSTTETGGGATPTYSWVVDGVVTGSTGSTYSYTPASGDIVAVVMTSDYTCTSATTVTTSVTMAIDVPTVTATSSTGCGGVATLTGSGATTYSWSPTTGLSCSTCSSATLLPSGSTTYTVTGTDGTGCTGTGTVSVDGNSISGYITYSMTPSAGDLKIWLIQFNPSDSVITATDSTLNCVDGGTAFYQFMDEPAGNYLVKADLLSSVPGTSGYIPTYSLSTPHWDSAATISHTSGADSLHINMVYGTVPAGPGFISGYVVSGAGRNTGDVPAVGMLIYLKDPSGNTITYNYTGSDGTYSFSNLAYGTYLIYPETFKYYTTPSAIVTLTPGDDSTTSVDFRQNRNSGTITPYTASKVPQIASSGNGVSIYPNPTTGNLNIQWNNQVTGNADVVITDMTGREVFTSTINMNVVSGQTQINLSNLNDGIYLYTIKSDKIYYSGKLEKQQ